MKWFIFYTVFMTPWSPSDLRHNQVLHVRTNDALLCQKAPNTIITAYTPAWTSNGAEHLWEPVNLTCTLLKDDYREVPAELFETKGK